MDSGFQVLDSTLFVSGTWIPDSKRFWDPDSLTCIPDSKAQDLPFHKKNYTKCGFTYSGRKVTSQLLTFIPFPQFSAYE